MAGSSKEEREKLLRTELLEGAPDLILLNGIDGPWIDYLCRKYGHSSRKLSLLFPSKAQAIDFILWEHLQLAFEAVPVLADWDGLPMDVLRAMSLALICYGTSHLSRHRVFLAEYERRPDAARLRLAQQMVHFANNFQATMHAATPGRPFAELHRPAELLLGQLLHAPLWWPSETCSEKPSTTLDAWVCTQLGLVTGLRRPDHRKPPQAAPRRPVKKGGDCTIHLDIGT